MTNPPVPTGPRELALMLGVSRQRVTQLLEADDFPPPWVELATGRIWRDADIATWAQARGRKTHPLDLAVSPPYSP